MLDTLNKARQLLINSPLDKTVKEVERCVAGGDRGAHRSSGVGPFSELPVRVRRSPSPSFPQPHWAHPQHHHQAALLHQAAEQAQLFVRLRDGGRGGERLGVSESNTGRGVAG